jgi:hypothetical protein
MAIEKVTYSSNGLPHNQQAPSQSARTNFTPGKANASAGELSWPKEFRIPTGNPVFDEAANGPAVVWTDIEVKLGRGVMGDQILPIPVITGVRVETVSNAFIDGTHVMTSTETPPNPSALARNSSQTSARSN